MRKGCKGGREGQSLERGKNKLIEKLVLIRKRLREGEKRERD